MNIILVITNSRGKNLVFVIDTLKIYSLKEAIGLVQNGKLKGAYTVRGRGGIYLRTKQNIPKKNELETLSITGRSLVAYARDARHAQSTTSMSNYIKLYTASLADGHAYILPVGQPKMLRVLTTAVKERLNAGRRHLYDYLIQPKHNVRFAAAFIQFVIDFWSRHIDLSSRTDIIGTLYHIGYGKPKIDPKADERGTQIANKFYPLAKRWLA